MISNETISGVFFISFFIFSLILILILLFEIEDKEENKTTEEIEMKTTIKFHFYELLDYVRMLTIVLEEIQDTSRLKLSKYDKEILLELLYKFKNAKKQIQRYMEVV